jgi:hypothetical protein
MIKKLRSSFSYALAALVILMLLPGIGRGQVVISQVYGGGGNTGATLKNDFIEIFNRGTTAVDLTNWSVQYASATGATWQVTSLSSISLAPGQYYLIQEAAGSGGTVDLPTPDAIGTIAMSGTAGKVALVNSTTALSGTCPTGYIDLVGFGSTANCYEGSGPTPAPSNTTSVSRASGGCTDVNNNSVDFTAGAPNPRNTASPDNVCALPSISVIPASITGFFYVAGSGPSASQTYDLSASNLTPVSGNITVTGSTNYEVSVDNSSFSGSVTVAYTSSVLASTPVYVRLKAGLTTGNYNSEVVTNAGGGATTANVTCSGSVDDQVDWCYLKGPSSGTITLGDNYNISGEVWATGITDAVGQGAGISGWIGYSTSNTDPSTWTHWVPATYDYDLGNDDVYVANVGADIMSGGNYYIASRFQLGTAPFVYGGTGGFWNGTTSPSGTLTVNAPPPPNAWFNEIHYDNVGTDVNEFIEVVVENTSSYNLANFKVELYNLTGGVVYDTKSLTDFTVGATFGNFTFYTYNYTVNSLSIQNGSNDGMALSYLNFLIPGQFLSYEGTLTGTGGSANGVLSTDIGVSEPGSPAGSSLQLSGVGTQYSDFIWQPEALNTAGNLNNDQSFFTSNTWNGSVSGVWNDPDNWDNGIPVSGMDITVPDVGNYPLLSSAAACKDLTIEDLAKIEIASSGSLTVSGVINNSAGYTGLVINSGGSLIQNNSSVSATINRTISDASDDKWHLFISPINESVQASSSSSFNGAYLDRYDEPTGAWDRLVTDAFVTSDQGYSINYLTGSRDLVFPGTLKSSPVSFTNLSYTSSSPVDDNYGSGWHLVGNPYTCGINPALCSLPTNMNAFAYVWDGGNYITPSLGSADVPGTIASLQGFFVRTTDASNSLTLANAAKLHGGIFYKSSNSVPQMLSLSIEGNNYSDKTYVRFNPDATANFDQAFDAYKRAGLDAAPQLFSIVPGEKATVNTLPDYTSNANVPLGLKVGAATTYTLNVSGMDSFDASLPINLYDLKTGITQDLRLNPVYSFTAAPGDAENRFTLSFASVTALDKQNRSGINMAAANGIIRITHNAPVSGTVYLYSVSGQLLATSKLNAGETMLRTASTGVFLVKVVTGKTTYTQKMVVLR